MIVPPLTTLLANSPVILVFPERFIQWAGNCTPVPFTIFINKPAGTKQPKSHAAAVQQAVYSRRQLVPVSCDIQIRRGDGSNVPSPTGHMYATISRDIGAMYLILPYQ